MKRPWRVPRWTWSHRLVAIGFLVLLYLGSRPWFPWLKGSASSTRLLDALHIVDPLAALEMILSSRTLPLEVLLGAGILVFLALLLGPLFCGWLCPLGLLLELNQSLRQGALRLVGGRRRPGRHSRRLPSGMRYAVLGLFAGFALAARLPAFQILSPINLVVWSLVFGASWALLVLAALALIELILPRLWCRALCPLGAFYSLVGRRGLLRVRIDPLEAGKTRCRQCTIHCPMGIAVLDEFVLPARSSIDQPECTRCGSCIDVCPSGTLKLGLRNPPANATPNGLPTCETCRPA